MVFETKQEMLSYFNNNPLVVDAIDRYELISGEIDGNITVHFFHTDDHSKPARRIADPTTCPPILKVSIGDYIGKGELLDVRASVDV